MSKKEIVNNLMEGSTKAVQLTDGKFVTQSLYYQHKMQALKLFLSWRDIKRIVNIADDLLAKESKTEQLEAEFQSEQAYYEGVLKRFKEEKK